MDNSRRVQIFQNDNWLDVKFMELKLGDKFRMFEPSGEPVVGDNENTEWEVSSNPFRNEQGYWMVETQ